MDIDSMRRQLPQAAPKSVLRYALKKHIDELGGERTVFKRVSASVAPDLLQAIMTPEMWEEYETSKRNKWAAECSCSVCKEVWYTGWISGPILKGICLVEGEDGLTYPCLDDYDPGIGTYIEVAPNDGFLCPYCSAVTTLTHAHFAEGYKTNNTYGIFAPVFLNANFHYWGDAYCRAARDAGYLGVRGNREQLDLSGTSIVGMEKAMFSNFDDEYRHVTPFFFAGAEAGTDQETKTKALIDRAIELGQNVLFSGHGVVKDGAAAGTMYESVSFMTNILAHLKEKVDAGLCVCTTWAEYVKDEAPELYAEWVEKKSRAEHNFVMKKLFAETAE